MPLFNVNILDTSRKNLLINGGFDVWQRGTSISTNTGYTSDRWVYSAGGATHSIDRVVNTNSNSISKYAMRATGAPGGSSNFPLQYRAESDIGIKLSNRYFTLSFYIKNKLSSVLTTSIKIDSFDVEDVFSPLTNVADVPIQDIPVSNDFVKVTLTLDGTTLNNIKNGFRFYLAGIPLMDNVLEYLEFSDVQLELGSTATEFEVKPYQEELRLCQRYYRTYTTGVIGSVISATQVFLGEAFESTMRTAPSVSLLDTTPTVRINAALDVTATSSVIGDTQTTSEGFMLTLSGFTALTIGDTSTLNNGVPCLAFEAEI